MGFKRVVATVADSENHRRTNQVHHVIMDEIMVQWMSSQVKDKTREDVEIMALRHLMYRLLIKIASLAFRT